MGLRKDVQTDIAKAFDTDLADAVLPFLLFRSELEYNNNTGNIIVGEINKGVAPDANNWRGVFSKARKQYIQDGAQLPVDTVVVCLTNEAPFLPDINDGIILQTSAIDTKGTDFLPRNNCYRILRIEVDPALASHSLLCQSGVHGKL